MAYNKTVWTNAATALSAENMNHIENGIEDLDTGKVDKVTGKGLSTNDYTTNEKNKLAGIATGAQVNPGNATTSAAGLMSAADKTKLNGIATGAEVNQNAFSNVKVGSTTIAADSKTDTLTLAAGSNVTLTPDATNDKVTIAATNTTYSSKNASSGGTDVSLVTTGEKYTWNSKAGTSVATTSANGLMSSSDKTKLNGIAAGAQVNPGNATTSAAGLMSSSDKTKLNGISTGAKNIKTVVYTADNITVNAGSYYDNLVISAAQTGWTLIGVVGWQINNASSGGTGWTYCYLPKLYVSGNAIGGAIGNRHASSNAKVKVTVTALYIQ